jgi:uncharacterized protein YdaU (DUF1376 family)
MATHEVGAYFLLLLYSWQGDRPGYIPNDEDWIRRITDLTPQQWQESRNILLGRWPVASDSDLRYNPRLVKEALKQQVNRELKSRAGQASAAKRAAAALSSVEEFNDAPRSRRRQLTAPKQKRNSISTPVASQVNGCSKTGQQETNLSVSISTSLPSSLRSEGAAEAGPSHTSLVKGVGIPTLEEVQAYASAKEASTPGALDEAPRFFNHFESNGWKVGGKTPMKKWQAAFNSWMLRRPQFQSHTGHTAATAPTRSSIAPRPTAPRSYS